MGTSTNRLVATVFGAVYLLVGLLIIFAVNPLHNIIHLAIGAALLIAGLKSVPAARSDKPEARPGALAGTERSVIVAEDGQGLADREVTMSGPATGSAHHPARVSSRIPASTAAARNQSINVTLPSAVRTGLPRVLPVRAFPAARTNMTAAVTAVQTIPAGLGRTWCPAQGRARTG